MYVLQNLNTLDVIKIQHIYGHINSNNKYLFYVEKKTGKIIKLICYVKNK